MKFNWELIWDNSKLQKNSYYEATYRAKVIGGWLMRHETCCDFQYKDEDHDYTGEDYVRPVDEEGYQNVRNTIQFIADPEYKWDIEEQE